MLFLLGLCSVAAVLASEGHAFGHDVFLEDTFMMRGSDIKLADTDGNSKLDKIEMYKMVKRVQARRYGGVERMGHANLFAHYDDGIGNKGDGVASVEDAFHFLQAMAKALPEPETGQSTPADEADPLKTFMLIAKRFSGVRKESSPMENALIERIFQLADPTNPYAKDYIAAEKLIHYIVVNRDHRQLSRDIVTFFERTDMNHDKFISVQELRDIDLYRVPDSIKLVFRNGQAISRASTPEEVRWLKHANEKATQAALNAGVSPLEQAARQRREDTVVRRALLKHQRGSDVMGQPLNAAFHVEL